MFNPDHRVAIFTRNHTAAMEVRGRIEYMLANVKEIIAPAVVYKGKHIVEFDNGSKISYAALTESSGRGMSIRTLILDDIERSRMSEEFYASIMPCMRFGRVITTGNEQWQQ